MIIVEGDHCKDPNYIKNFAECRTNPAVACQCSTSRCSDLNAPEGERKAVTSEGDCVVCPEGPGLPRKSIKYYFGRESNGFLCTKTGPLLTVQVLDVHGNNLLNLPARTILQMTGLSLIDVGDNPRFLAMPGGLRDVLRPGKTDGSVFPCFCVFSPFLVPFFLVL
jgi:hypothetical protein